MFHSCPFLFESCSIYLGDEVPPRPKPAFTPRFVKLMWSILCLPCIRADRGLADQPSLQGPRETPTPFSVGKKDASKVLLSTCSMSAHQ
ncbi:hypothetical protein CEXT_793071 [Caerostris extrusa]|uniref:Uncharacterized protein n=1 Tax=Caerostris extrusa TaxID=172846 RepID=A0AAV4VFA9_CAEEX|nr:hypothetical protein CEXT_793071 [Caerostris extrusa]